MIDGAARNGDGGDGDGKSDASSGSEAIINAYLRPVMMKKY